MAYLEIKDFYKNFGDIEVLKGIDLQIEKSEVLSIIGSSGSGKTTLLRCINFLESVDSGVMLLDGETLINGSIKNEREAELRKKRLNFGLVFQSFNLFPQYNVLKNITLAPTLLLSSKEKVLKKQLKKQAKTDKTLTRKVIKHKVLEFTLKGKEQIEENAKELLKKIGLTEKANAYPCELSGGQSQRVAIARALALDPKVLCFDEPTSALDPELTGEVLKVIKELKETSNKTMIIVTHEMEFAKNISDKVLFMADGKVEEIGTPNQIFNNPKSQVTKQFLQNYLES